MHVGESEDVGQIAGYNLFVLSATTMAEIVGDTRTHLPAGTRDRRRLWIYHTASYNIRPVALGAGVPSRASLVRVEVVDVFDHI